MKVLVACEYSGRVRDAFKALGHDAWSCDIIPTDAEGQHIIADVLTILDQGWDLMIAHPPCTYLASSGAAWFKYRIEEQKQALEFVQKLMDAPIPKIAIENPVGVISTRIRKPDQIIQPYEYGDLARKSTCLWLKDLPKLVPTNNRKEELYALPKNKQNPLHYLPPSKNRGKLRSLTYQCIANAFAAQWGLI